MHDTYKLHRCVTYVLVLLYCSVFIHGLTCVSKSHMSNSSLLIEQNFPLDDMKKKKKHMVTHLQDNLIIHVS